MKYDKYLEQAEINESELPTKGQINNIVNKFKALKTAAADLANAYESYDYRGIEPSESKKVFPTDVRQWNMTVQKALLAWMKVRTK